MLLTQLVSHLNPLDLSQLKMMLRLLGTMMDVKFRDVIVVKAGEVLKINADVAGDLCQ